jgi:uncharacterized membrane protein YphA (DoxX/SURF4 family)
MAKITTQDRAWEATPAVEDVYDDAPTGTWDRVRMFLTGPYPTIVSRLLLGGILFLAGLAKIGVPDSMKASIKAYEIALPDFVVNAMAVGLPVIETVIGAFLLLGLFTRFSAGVGAFILAVFTVAITSAWLRGLDISCGCFGGTQSNPMGVAILNALGPIGTYLQNERANLETIIRDVILTLMGIHLIFVPTIWSLDRLRQRGAEVEE